MSTKRNSLTNRTKRLRQSIRDKERCKRQRRGKSKQLKRQRGLNMIARAIHGK